MNTPKPQAHKASDLLPPSRHHLWGPERRRLSSHLIQKALDALPGSRSSSSSSSPTEHSRYKSIKRPYDQQTFTGKKSRGYVPEAGVSERRSRKERGDRPLTPGEGYGFGVLGMGFEVLDGGWDGKGMAKAKAKENVERKFLGQGGSMFFEKLPREVRMKIYWWVLGGRTLHVVKRTGRLGHVVCRCEGGDEDGGMMIGDEDRCLVAGCGSVKIPGGGGVCERTGEGGGGGEFIQLLQVCRRIYSEAIPLLYSANTFNFHSLETLISFSNETLPHRFDNITSLSLTLNFSTSHLFNESTCNNLPRWERTWMIIGSMKSLERIRTSIVWPRVIPAWSHESRLLEPLKMVGGLEREEFVVGLRELTREARKRGKARAYEVGKGFDVGNARVVPAVGFEEETEEDLPFKIVRLGL